MSKAISWNDQLAFLAVLEGGSLSAAARRLSVSHATIRNRIESLEVALSAKLFTRSVNGLTPTENALALREPARAMAMASDQFVRLATAPASELAGVVRISVPEFMGVEVMPPILKKLRDQHPAIQVELSLTDTQADVLAQEVDIAVRTTTPTQGALVARRVAQIPLGLFASIDYLEQRGEPTTVSDLSRHDLIGPDRNRRDRAFVEHLDANLSEANLVIRTDSHPAQLAAARAGLGIAVTQVPAGEVDTGLRRVLSEVALAHLETWLVTHEDLRHVPKVRAVLECLSSAFGDFVP